jgi:Spy/CpxP family protein refolding chaperone
MRCVESSMFWRRPKTQAYPEVCRGFWPASEREESAQIAGEICLGSVQHKRSILSGGIREEPMRQMIMIVVLVAAATTAGGADFNLPHGKWWENERVVQRIGLTEEQQAAISDLVYQHALKMIDLNAGLRKAEFELGDLVDRDDFDPTAVRKSFGAFRAAKDKLEYERFEMLLAVRGELTADQWRSLLEIRRYLEQKRENRRPGAGAPGGTRPPGAGERRQPVDGGFG